MQFHDITDDFEPELEEKAKLALPASALYPIPMLISMAIQNLPPKEEAWSLLETFFQQAVSVAPPSCFRRIDFWHRHTNTRYYHANTS